MAGAEECAPSARGERVNLRVAYPRWPRAEPTILREEVARNSQRAWIRTHWVTAYKRVCGGLVRPEGIEPPTLWSEARCSNPLSYGRMCTARFWSPA